MHPLANIDECKCNLCSRSDAALVIQVFFLTGYFKVDNVSKQSLYLVAGENQRNRPPILDNSQQLGVEIIGWLHSIQR